jgi:hypothetical protein
MVLQRLDVDEQQREDILSAFRARYHAQIYDRGAP